MAPRSKGDKRRESDSDLAGNGHDDDVASYEKELASMLNQRIKPGLNRGSIPLLARSIAKEIADREFPQDDVDDEWDDENGAEADDEAVAESDGDAADDDRAEPEASLDLETELHDIQEKLGDDWILYFSVKGGDAWLTAEKEDASQRVEAPTASVLVKAVKVLNAGGGRSRRAGRDAD